MEGEAGGTAQLGPELGRNFANNPVRGWPAWNRASRSWIREMRKVTSPLLVRVVLQQWVPTGVHHGPKSSEVAMPSGLHLRMPDFWLWHVVRSPSV